MQQEINLYHLLPKKKKSFLTIQLLTISYGLFLSLILINWGFQFWNRVTEIKNIAILKKELSMIQMKLVAISAQYPIINPNDIQNSIVQLEQSLEDKNKNMNLLIQNKNFPIFLVAIAKASIPRLWLNDIEITLEDKKINLMGSAVDTNSVQEFLDNLMNQSEFLGLNFKLKELTKNQSEDLKSKNIFNFIITTKVET